MKENNEIWRDIVGYEGIYNISNLGRIMSLLNSRGNKLSTPLIKSQQLQNGYKRIIFWKNGKCNAYSVHRLVAIAFIPNPDNKPNVNHIDGNRSNNNIDNLEWVTQAENTLHMYRILGHSGNRLGMFEGNHPTAKAIIQYDLSGRKLCEYDSIISSARKLKISANGICMNAKGQRKTHCGFIFKYKKEREVYNA